MEGIKIPIRYCYYCGRRLVYQEHSEDFDIFTGKPNFLFLKCPKARWFNFCGAFGHMKHHLVKAEKEQEYVCT